MRTFFISYITLTILALIGAVVIYAIKGYVAAFTDFTSSLVFFAVLTPLVFLFVNSGLKGENNFKFFNYFYAAFGIKMVLAIFFALVYIVFTGHKGLSFGLSFGGLYVGYTGIETFALVLASQAAAAAQRTK